MARPPQGFPSLFISHGAPDLPLRSGPVVDFLQGVMARFSEQPRGILVVSAHWGTPEPRINAHPHPQTLYDFRGFPAELYQITYPAPGDPLLARGVQQLLQAAGFSSQLAESRGWDHGVWTPLVLMAPRATIPVVQLSLQPHLGPAHHLRIGEALQPLRQEGVLILGSGATTHRLQAFGTYAWDAEPPEQVQQFETWLTMALAQGQVDQLLNYRRVAPCAQFNHPSEEHLLPLFVALGAGGSLDQGQQIHRSTTYGVFSMAAYAFGAPFPPIKTKSAPSLIGAKS